MKVTEEGTTNISKWYQPESAEECKSIDCRKCVFYSYVPSSSSCPFEAWMINHPAEKPTGTGESNDVLQDQRSAQDILNMCATLQANTLQMQVEPLENIAKMLNLLVAIKNNQTQLAKAEHEQPVQEDQSNIPLWFMPSMENANDDVDGRDHYHHCPQKDNKLVRLIYVEEDKVHACPTCRRVFYLK